MKDFLNIGCSPTGEPCASVGQPDYYDRAPRECRTFRDQLRRVFGPEPEGAKLRVKSFPHDFGAYYEVVCYFDDDFQESVDYAFRLEGETPEFWDNEALAELKAQSST